MPSATLDKSATAAAPESRVGDATPTEDADELLSRIAGDEINRLIEAEGGGLEKEDVSVPALDASVVDDELAARAEVETKKVEGSLSAPHEETGEASGSEESSPDASLNAEVLNAVLKDVEPAGPDPVTATTETIASETTEVAADLVEPEAVVAEQLAEQAVDPLPATPSESEEVSVEPLAEVAHDELASTPEEFTTEIPETESTIVEPPVSAPPPPSAPAGAQPLDATNAPPLLNDTPAAAPKKKVIHNGPPFLTAQDVWKPKIETNVLADLPDLMPDWQARLLAPLLFLNRPFENLSPQTRSLLGLLALLTLFNSAVVAVWAIFFKH